MQQLKGLCSEGKGGLGLLQAVCPKVQVLASARGLRAAEELPLGLPWHRLQPVPGVLPSVLTLHSALPCLRSLDLKAACLRSPV